MIWFYSMTDDNTVVSNVMDNVKLDSNKLKIDGTKYSIASDSTVYVLPIPGHHCPGSRQLVLQGTATIAQWVAKNSEGDNIQGRFCSIYLWAAKTKIKLMRLVCWDVNYVHRLHQCRRRSQDDLQCY